jgi:uncharacterized membrane protein
MSMPSTIREPQPAEPSLARGIGRAPLRVTNSNGGYDRRGISNDSGRQLTRAVGWFSLGFGAAALAAPHKIAQFAGLPGNGGNQMLVRAIGLRELASGIGILTQQDPSSWLWARVGGDALDLALLTRAMGDARADRGRVATATAAVIGVTALDAYATKQMTQDQNGVETDHSQPRAQEPRVASAITVNAPIAEVFAAWDGFSSAPRFMDSFAAVRVTDDRLSHWDMALPAGLSVSWDAAITDVVPNERIAWRTGDASTLSGSGEVRFRPAPGDRGTEILFEARFDPPGGELGDKIAGLFTDPLGVKLNNDLRRFKQLTELGEIVKSDDSIVKGPNPAQPVAQDAAS